MITEFNLTEVLKESKLDDFVDVLISDDEANQCYSKIINDENLFVIYFAAGKKSSFVN
ncbi:MAG: hypothetical protein J0L79_01450 [Rickettsiales bacterium]|nr:hypothetical protein [Rickettsiales bacterium]MCA0254897.1 hypothetical protein [Pseudomonadota bacterium]